MRSVILTLFLMACANEAVSTERTNNTSIPVDTLFEKDDCTVYRFYDAGEYRYFVKCADARSASTISTENCGKNCQQSIEIPTVTVR